MSSGDNLIPFPVVTNERRGISTKPDSAVPCLFCHEAPTCRELCDDAKDAAARRERGA